MKKLILGLLFLSSLLFSPLFAIENKTFVYFINGDWFYKGPNFEESGIRLKDQANELYLSLLRRAKADNKNNYVLFYDPKGKGHILNKKWVKFRIFKKTKSLYHHRLRDAEIDTSSEEFMKMFAARVRKELGKMDSQSSVFFYYGEHFPAYGETQLDLSSDSTFGLDKLLKLMKSLGQFHTAIFQTCYINAIDFISPLLDVSGHVIVPRKAILNTPLNFDEAYSQKTLKSFNQVLVDTNSQHERYQWTIYDEVVKKIFQNIEELKGKVEKNYWKKMLNHYHQGSEELFKEVSPEAFFLRDWNDETQKELFMPLYEIINLMDRYLLEDFELGPETNADSNDTKLDQIDKVLERHPELQGLFILLPKPLS